MSNLTTKEQDKTLTTKQNNLIEKFTTDNFHKITTRAGQEDFSMVTITDEKIQKIADRMPEINRGLNAFSKTNTQLVSLGLTLSEATPERNIRQIHAQIESKRGALSESQFRLLKQQNDLKRKIIRREEIQEASYKNEAYRELDLDRVDIDIDEIKSKMVDGRVHVEQAIKEIGMYQDAYFDIVETFGLEDWDEEDMEVADIEYNLKRCFYQSLRSCRQIRHINEPNQEWLEQLGINPSFVQAEILLFLEHETEVMTEMLKDKEGGFGDNMDAVDEFVNHLVTKYKSMPTARIESRGMKTHKYKDWIFTDKNREQSRLTTGPESASN